jgi:hypothetical protein
MTGAPTGRSTTGIACGGARASLTAEIRLLLASDQALTRHRREMTREHLDQRDTCEVCGGSGEGAIASEDDCAACGGSGVNERGPDRLGSELRDLCRDLALDCLCRGFQRQLLTTALDLVDWMSLAETYILEETERPG